MSKYYFQKIQKDKMKTSVIVLILALAATVIGQDPNCLMPGPSGTCLACNTYFYLKDGQCLPVNANCLGYNPVDGKCTSCMIGFQMNDRGECIGGAGATGSMTGTSFGGSSIGGVAGLGGSRANTVVTRTTTTSRNFSSAAGGLGGLDNLFQSASSGDANFANSALTAANFGVLGVTQGATSSQASDGIQSRGQTFFNSQASQGGQGGQSWQTTTVSNNAGGLTSGASNLAGMSSFGGSSSGSSMGSSMGSSTTSNQNVNSGQTTTTVRTVTSGTAPTAVQTFSSQGIP